MGENFEIQVIRKELVGRGRNSVLRCRHGFAQPSCRPHLLLVQYPVGSYLYVPHHATDPHRQSGRIHQTPPRLQRQNAQHRLILTSVTLDPTLTTDACPELAGGLRITTFGFIGVHQWLALDGLPLAGHLLGFDHLRRVHVLGHVFYKIIHNLNFKTGKYAV